MTEDFTHENPPKPQADKIGKRQTRRTGQIVERGADKFLLRIFLGRDSAGKRHYHDETFHGKKKKAQERLRELLTKQKTGEPLKLSKDTFNSFLDEWLNSRPDLREESRRHYERMLERYVRPRLGNRLLTKIEAADVQALYSYMRDELQLSRNTIQYVHTMLRGAFKLAVRRRRIVFNPMDGVDTPGGKNLAEELRERREARTMTPAQVDAFLSAANESRFGVLFSLAFFTGCRPGELLGLRWDDLDATARTLTIRHTLHWRKAGEWYLERPKTAASRRVLHLTAEQLELLAAQRKSQLEERMKMGRAWHDHNFIFTDELGRPHPQERLRYHFKEFLKATGLPSNFTPYSARHTAATILAGSGVDAKTVSQRMGHKDVRTTLQIYTHPTGDMQQTASEELQRALKGRK